MSSADFPQNAIFDEYLDLVMDLKAKKAVKGGLTSKVLTNAERKKNEDRGFVQPFTWLANAAQRAPEDLLPGGEFDPRIERSILSKINLQLLWLPSKRLSFNCC